jgi:HIRAN domain-containing protein
VCPSIIGQVAPVVISIGLLVLAILLWLMARRSTKSPSRSNRAFFQQVHGINFKNDDGSSRQAIIGRCYVGEELELVPEPANRFDPDAVKICRKNGEQLGYWPADGRMAHDLASGWTYRVTIDEIYPFKENRKKHGVRLRVEVLTMSRKTEERKKRAAGEAPSAVQPG